jgi:hypothetical protein
MGSSGRRFAYAVAGTALNLETWPGGITKGHGADIIVGARARNAVPDFVCSKLDQVRVKGKSNEGRFTFRAKW